MLIVIQSFVTPAPQSEVKLGGVGQFCSPSPCPTQKREAYEKPTKYRIKILS